MTNLISLKHKPAHPVLADKAARPPVPFPVRVPIPPGEGVAAGTLTSQALTAGLAPEGPEP
ncbi:MAG: hypothetical protein WDZ30_01410 [Cellvibrionaceae bacterium]